MEKQQILAPAIFLFTSIWLSGQITLSRQDFTLTPDDTVYYSLVSDFDLSLPAEGANRIWDYSHILYLGDVQGVLEPGNSPEIQNATHSREFFSYSAFNPFVVLSERVFERLTDTSYEVVGRQYGENTMRLWCLFCGIGDSVTILGDTVAYEQPLAQLRFPLEYGDGWSVGLVTQSVFNIKAPGFGLNNIPAGQLDSLVVRSEAAGWGTLVLPDTAGNTISLEVLLVKRTSFQASRYTLNGMAAPESLLNLLGRTSQDTFTSTSYHFYAKGLNRPAFSIGYDNDEDRISSASVDTRLLQMPIVQVKKRAAPVQSIKIYPNPARQDFFLEFELLKTTKVKVELFNATGQQVQTLYAGDLGPGKHSYDFQMVERRHPQGIYYLSLVADGHRTGKWITLK